MHAGEAAEPQRHARRGGEAEDGQQQDRAEGVRADLGQAQRGPPQDPDEQPRAEEADLAEGQVPPFDIAYRKGQRDAGSTSSRGRLIRTNRSASKPIEKTWNAAKRTSNVFVPTRQSLSTRS